MRAVRKWGGWCAKIGVARRGGSDGEIFVEGLGRKGIATTKGSGESGVDYAIYAATKASLRSADSWTTEGTTGIEIVFLEIKGCGYAIF